MDKFKNIALVRNVIVDTEGIVVKINNYLEKRGHTVLPEQSCRDALPAKRFYQFSELSHADLAIVIGGDGSLLYAARNFGPQGVPILGVNLGRLGFLVDISPKKLITTLGEILDGNYREEQRFLLQAEIVRNESVLQKYIAVNDVVINNHFQTRMIEFYTHINEHYVNHERADGVVIATPTGSTAYALSAGGPILHPALDAITLVPICPHTLNHRPLVIDASSTVAIKIDPDCRVAAQASFDGQENIILEPGDCIEVKRSKINMHLLHPEGYEFFDILRAKLRWGKQPDEGSPR